VDLPKEVLENVPLKSDLINSNCVSEHMSVIEVGFRFILFKVMQVPHC